MTTAPLLGGAPEPRAGGALRVVIAGGGTGGHLFPGIAVAQELVRRTGASITFVGSDHGIERTAVPRAGFRVELLSIRGLRREGWSGVVRALGQVPASVLAARRVLRRIAPDLVIGVGGYASFPAVAAAVLARIPVVLIEQNARPGLATRALAPFARRVCVSFPATACTLGRKAVVTGNPVRSAARASGGGAGSEVGSRPWSAEVCAEMPSKPAEARVAASPKREAELSAAAAAGRRVLVFGGSAGAHRLNVVVPQALARVGRPLAILHQTGEADRDEVAGAYRALGLEADVRAFVDDMVAAYGAADLAICRAGATTIAELTALGVPAVLVPFPFAAGDHQRWNALQLVDAGAAWMVLDRELEPDRLAALIREVFDDPAHLTAMRARSLTLGRPDAAARVADECLAVISAAALGKAR